MAKAAAAGPANTIKIPDDIEYRVIGNALGLLIACGGLLTGTMMMERSLDYWLHDITPLVLVLVMGFRLMRNMMSLMVLSFQGEPAHHPRPPIRQTVQAETAPIAQLPEVPGFSEEEVLEEVVRRIEAKRAKEAMKQVEP